MVQKGYIKYVLLIYDMLIKLFLGGIHSVIASSWMLEHQCYLRPASV